VLGLDGYLLAVAAGRTLWSFRVTSDTAVTICHEGTGAHELGKGQRVRVVYLAGSQVGTREAVSVSVLPEPDENLAPPTAEDAEDVDDETPAPAPTRDWPNLFDFRIHRV
jgi:hypothetical protein